MITDTFKVELSITRFRVPKIILEGIHHYLQEILFCLRHGFIFLIGNTKPARSSLKNLYSFYVTLYEIVND